MNADPATDLNGLNRNNNPVVELLEKSKKIQVVETMVTTTPLMMDIAALVHHEGIFERDVAYNFADDGFNGMREKHRAVRNTIDAMVAIGHFQV